MAAENPDVYNMFILGLYAMQRVAETNIYSYYEIAGIHGAPYKSWGEDQTPANPLTLGYCTHSSALFATWHRPYLSLVEQRIHNHAIQEAAKFKDGNAARYRDAARRVRLPYWDWAAPDLAGRLPTQLTTATVSVVNANPSTGAAQRVTVNNPLYTYRFTSNRHVTDFGSSSLRNVAQTLRQPPSNLSGSNNAAASNSAAAGYSSRRQNTYNLFSITRFNEFSNRSFRAGGSPASFNNLESVHDNIHVDMGGNNGHMTWVHLSAFDPVFFLHHCNVDRLVAIFQAARPGLQVTPQAASANWANPRPSGNDDINTPLRPFRKASGAIYTSADVSTASSIWSLNYAYPEVPYRFNGQSAASLQSFARGRVNALYGPTGSGKMKRDLASYVVETPEIEKIVPVTAPKREYLLHCVFNTKDLWGGGQVLIYFGKPNDDPAARVSEKNLIGQITSFSVAEKMDMEITGTVPLTDAIDAYGFGLDPNSTIPFLAADLEWVVMKGGKEVPIETIPSLKIGVSAADVNYVDGLKEFSAWETYYEVTKDLPGGSEESDHALVDSKPAEEILESILDGVKDTTDKIDEALQGIVGDWRKKARSKKERFAKKVAAWKNLRKDY